MTFKHGNFGDSATMRSLEKVAHEKGWVKNDPMKKIAASQTPDLNPSINFMENVVKLCSGLRHSGFDKYADELESAFFAYKQAGTHYDVCNEKGEDLVDAAHPQGGHQMEGVQGDAFVETILEKHMKMLEVTNKEPKAKLAGNTDILKAVKKVLAQDALGNLYAQATEAFAQFKNIVTDIAEKTGKGTDYNSRYFNMLQSILVGKRVNQNNNFQDSLSDTLENLRSDVEPGVFSVGNDFQNWNNVKPLFVVAKKYADRFNLAVTKIREMESGSAAREVDPENEPTKAPTMMKEVEVTANPIVSGATALISKLNAYKAVGPIARNRDAMTWIAGEIKEIQDLIKRMNSIPAGQEDTVTSYMQKELAEKTNEVNEFAAAWTK